MSMLQCVSVEWWPFWPRVSSTELVPRGRWSPSWPWIWTSILNRQFQSVLISFNQFQSVSISFIVFTSNHCNHWLLVLSFVSNLYTFFILLCSLCGWQAGCTWYVIKWLADEQSRFPVSFLVLSSLTSQIKSEWKLPCFLGGIMLFGTRTVDNTSCLICCASSPSVKKATVVRWSEFVHLRCKLEVPVDDGKAWRCSKICLPFDVAVTFGTLSYFIVYRAIVYLCIWDALQLVDRAIVYKVETMTWEVPCPWGIFAVSRIPLFCTVLMFILGCFFSWQRYGFGHVWLMRKLTTFHDVRKSEGSLQCTVWHRHREGCTIYVWSCTIAWSTTWRWNEAQIMYHVHVMPFLTQSHNEENVLRMCWECGSAGQNLCIVLRELCAGEVLCARLWWNSLCQARYDPIFEWCDSDVFTCFHFSQASFRLGQAAAL